MHAVVAIRVRNRRYSLLPVRLAAAAAAVCCAMNLGATPLNDYTGAGRSDLAVYQSGTGRWYIRTVDGDVLAWGLAWGFNGAIPVPGDYDGDGVADLAVYDTNSGRWYIRTMDGTTLAWGLNWGGRDTRPVPGDYNNDGRTDLAVWNRASGSWFIRTLDGQVLAWGVNWGSPDMRPSPGDFDGDGLCDLAVMTRDGTWYVRSLNGNLPLYGYYLWSQIYTLDRRYPVSGDFDGDGTTDPVTYDLPSGWYEQYVSASAKWEFPSNASHDWGGKGMLPVAGSYDGDALADMGVYDVNTGRWYIRRMADPYGPALIYGLQWGGPGMIPVGAPGDYPVGFVAQYATGGIHPWNGTLPGDLRPAPGTTALRALLGPERRVQISRCTYSRGSVITRYQYRMDVSIVDPRGTIVRTGELNGSTPSSCPYVIFGGGGTRTGSRVPASALTDWLREF